MSDGTLSVRRRDPKASLASSAADTLTTADALRSGNYDALLGGGTVRRLGEPRYRQDNKTRSKQLDDVNEFRVENRRKKRLRDYDRLLKSFKYGAALDSVLRKVSSKLLSCVRMF
jgi:U3 small nucleolar RNA-associated protein 15